MQLEGVFTALVTPFNDGSVDYAKIRELVSFQIEADIDGIVPVGTTGESPTLTVKEHLKVIQTVIEAAKGRCSVIAGTGANSTVEAIELTKEAKKLGADASLQVTPYYNKPTQEGLYKHFSVVAEEAGLPIVLYNIPGRSGVPIAVETIVRLNNLSNVIAVKEAGGSADRVSEILDACEITVLSGDDALTLPMMSVGGKGVISVASNLIPKEMKALTNAFLSGDAAKALEIHARNYKLFKNLFIETNPVPIKAAMAMKGMIEEEYRLPMCPMSDSNRAILEETLQNMGIL